MRRGAGQYQPALVLPLSLLRLDLQASSPIQSNAAASQTGQGRTTAVPAAGPSNSLSRKDNPALPGPLAPRRGCWCADLEPGPGRRHIRSRDHAGAPGPGDGPMRDLFPHTCTPCGGRADNRHRLERVSGSNFPANSAPSHAGGVRIAETRHSRSSGVTSGHGRPRRGLAPQADRRNCEGTQRCSAAASPQPTAAGSA